LAVWKVQVVCDPRIGIISLVLPGGTKTKMPYRKGAKLKRPVEENIAFAGIELRLYNHGSLYTIRHRGGLITLTEIDSAYADRHPIEMSGEKGTFPATDGTPQNNAENT